MKYVVFGILLGWCASVSATTLQMLTIYHPVSLKGTDGDALPAGFRKPIQATVMPRPLVLQGVLPESLISAMLTPLQVPVLPAVAPYRETEVNLLTLSGIQLRSFMERTRFVVTVDLTKMQAVPGLEITETQLLMLTLQAIEATLEESMGHQKDPMKVHIRIVGTKEGQDELGKMEKDLLIGGESSSRLEEVKP